MKEKIHEKNSNPMEDTLVEEERDYTIDVHKL